MPYLVGVFRQIVAVHLPRPDESKMHNCRRVAWREKTAKLTPRPFQVEPADRDFRPPAAPANSASLILWLEDQRGERRQHEFKRLLVSMGGKRLDVHRASVANIAAAIDFRICVE